MSSESSPHEAVTAPEPLLSPAFLTRLEQLSLVVNRAFAGRMHGERRSTRRGASVEFADFRAYVHGDDLRGVDWNAYARTERLFLKLFVDEQDLHLHLLLDTSRSMGFGQPEKLLTACRIGAALSYIALSHLDRLSITAINDHLGARLSNVRGKGSAANLFTWLSGLRADGATDFARTLAEYTLLARKPGLVIIISDFLAPGVEDGLRALVGRRFAPVLVRVMAPEEIAPNFTGDLRLVDAETGAAREVTITAGTLARYRQRMQAHREYLAGVCTRFGVQYMETATDEPLEALILRYFKVRGVVQ